jgi:tetratricopeptide (TPR) repeat protein
VVLAFAPVAAAEPPAEEDAGELFRAGAEAYSEGRFAEAVKLLREAYRRKPEPVLLYNVGRACEGMGDLACAADAYERYLETEPELEDKGAIEQRIATLRRQLAEAKRDEQRAEGAQKVEAPAPSPVPWIIASVGVLGVGAGTVLAVVATVRHDAAPSEPSQVDAFETQAQAETLATAANVAFVVGGALALGGVVWGIVDVTTGREDQASVGIAATMSGIRVDVSF